MIRTLVLLFLLAAAPAFGRATTRAVINANGSSSAASNCNFPLAPLTKYDFVWGTCFQGSAIDMTHFYEGNVPGSNSSGREVVDQDHVRNGEFDEQMGVCSFDNTNPYCVGRLVSVMPIRDGQYCEFVQKNSYLTGFGNSTFFEGEYEGSLNYPGRTDFPTGFRNEMDVMQSRGNINLIDTLTITSAPTAASYIMLSGSPINGSNPSGCTVASATSACAVQFVNDAVVTACGASATGTGNNQNSVDISSGNTTTIATKLAACMNTRTTGDFTSFNSTASTNTIAVDPTNISTSYFSYSGASGTINSVQTYNPDYPAGVDLIYWTGPNNGSAYAGGHYPWNFIHWPAGWMTMTHQPRNDGTEHLLFKTDVGAGSSVDVQFGVTVAVGATIGETMDNLNGYMQGQLTGPAHSYNWAHIIGSNSIAVQTKNVTTFYMLNYTTPGTTPAADMYQTEWDRTQSIHTYGFEPTEGGVGSAFGQPQNGGWNLYIDGRLWVGLPFPAAGVPADGQSANWPHGNISVKISGTAKDTGLLYTWWNPNPTRIYRYGCYIKDYYIHTSPSALLNYQVMDGTFTSVTQASVNTPLAVSTTSNTIGTGSKTFTVATGTNYSTGTWALISDASGAGNWMAGIITAETATSLTINATKTNGSGTISSWVIESGGGEEPFTPAGHYSETAGVWRNTYAPLLGYSGTIYWNDTNTQNYSTASIVLASNPTDTDTLTWPGTGGSVFTFKSSGGVCDGSTFNVAIQGTAAGTTACLLKALQVKQGGGLLYHTPSDALTTIIPVSKGGGYVTQAGTFTSGVTPPTVNLGNSLAQPGRACMAASAGASGCVACFIPSIVKAATYDVQIWQDYATGLNSSAGVTITDHTGAHAQTAINQTSGTSGWIDYGNFSFDPQKATAGSCSGQGIQFSGNIANGTLVTNFVKIVQQ